VVKVKYFFGKLDHDNENTKEIIYWLLIEQKA
jgi:hypothetical protein